MPDSANNGRKIHVVRKVRTATTVRTAIHCRFEQNEYQTLCGSSDRDGEATVNLRRTSREVLDLCIVVCLRHGRLYYKTLHYKNFSKFLLWEICRYTSSSPRGNGSMLPSPHQLLSLSLVPPLHQQLYPWLSCVLHAPHFAGLQRQNPFPY